MLRIDLTCHNNCVHAATDTLVFQTAVDLCFYASYDLQFVVVCVLFNCCKLQTAVLPLLFHCSTVVDVFLATKIIAYMAAHFTSLIFDVRPSHCNNVVLTKLQLQTAELEHCLHVI